MKRLVLISVAAALTITALASCTDDDPADPPPPTTTSPTQADEEALRQLADSWAETSRQIYVGDAEVEVAEDYLTGSYLAGFREQATEFLSSDETGRLSDKTTHEVEKLEIDPGGSTAIVTECVVDADAIIDAEGSAIDDTVVSKRYRSTATSTPEGWRFSERETVSETEGATACPPE